MNFKIKATEFFIKQVSNLPEKDKRAIKQKIKLIKLNPYRFKAIHSKKFSRVFRVRMKIKGKETRLIYVILEPEVIIACLLLRKKDYKELEKYLNKIKNSSN